MQRRSFIGHSAALGLGAMLPLSSCSSVKEPTYKLGLQLFSINDDMNKAPLETLKAVKAMGYEDFEIYGFDDQAITYYGIEAKTLKGALDDMELTVTSGHYGFSDYMTRSESELQRFVDQIIKGAKALGSPYIAWPWLAPEFRNREGFKRMVPLLNKIGKQITQAGLGFAYHNHGYEFEDFGGENGYEMIMKETDPALVKFQLDMYWLAHSTDLTPTELIKRDPGRFVMWHIKDMDKETRDYTELGNGSIDYKTYLPDPELSGLEYYYIEQGGNFTHSPMESAATSAEYFKKHLQQFL